MDDQQQVPDAALLRHLLTLRFMLGDATRWATQAGPERLTTAVILLDGVVERAVNLAAAEAGVHVGPRDDAVQVTSKLRAEAPAWAPPAWRDIADLHRARNSAQHAGQRPHPGDIGPWTTAVGAFVRDVVRYHLGLELDRVALTDAVQEPNLRRMLETAAAALEAGDFGRSVFASVSATTRALWWWMSAQRVDSGVKDAFANPPGPAKRLDAVERRAALSTFAQDPAEVAWFTVLTDELASVDADDADRALAFATSWILGYEATMHSWVSGREQRAHRAARRVRQVPDSVAYIADGSIMLRGDAVIAILTLADVPDADAYDVWKIFVERIIDEGTVLAGEGRIRPDGTVHLIGKDAAQLREQMVALDAALKGADARMEADQAADGRRQGDEAARAAQYEQALRELGGLPSWVSRARPGEGGLSVTLTLAAGYEWLGSSADRLPALLELDRRVIRAIRRSTNQVDVTPVLAPAALLDLLTRVDPQVQEQARAAGEREVEVARIGAEQNRLLLEIIRELDERARG